jgi:alkylmercury lyase
MPTDTLAHLTTTLTQSLCDCGSGECRFLHVRDPGLCRTLLHLLAEGQPVSVGRLADAIEKPVADIATLIQASTNVELDDEGSIVGSGLTLRPTQHQMRVNGRTLYTWCALDTLMYAPLLEQKAEIESPCASTGTLIQVVVSPSGVESVTPASAVVSMVVPDSRLHIRQSFCNYVHFFRSAEAANAWLSQHPGAVVLSVAEAYELGMHLTARHGRLGPSRSSEGRQ